MKNINKQGFDTKAIHSGHKKNEFGTLTTPIYATSTFVFDNAEQGGNRFAMEEKGYIYGRLGNPTTTVFEEKMNSLEGAEASVATSSGIGAISSTCWTLLKAGDHLLADETLYGCTFAYFSHGLTKFGIDVTFIDMSNLEDVKNNVRENTKMLYFETPVNPNLKIVDIEKVIKIAKNKNKDIITVVDNTFSTPYLQQPLRLGADLVIHSVTKYLNGHGDVIAGIVCGREELITEIKLVGIKDMTGSVLSAQDAYLIIRGMKTLGLRMKKHCENAKLVCEFLDNHPKVEKLYYPGLKSHPNYEVAKKQMEDFGAIIAFEIKGGYDAGVKLLNSLKLCTLAVSLGDTETLVQHPPSMTHSPYTEEELLKIGISQGLVRISVGLENPEDIIDDLKNAIDCI